MRSDLDSSASISSCRSTKEGWYRWRIPSMLAHDFTPGGRIRTHHKDLGIVLEIARTYGVPLPVTALVDQMFASLIERGRGDLDHSALLTHLEDMAAHRIGEREQ